MNEIAVDVDHLVYAIARHFHMQPSELTNRNVTKARCTLATLLQLDYGMSVSNIAKGIGAATDTVRVLIGGVCWNDSTAGMVSKIRQEAWAHSVLCSDSCRATHTWGALAGPRFGIRSEEMERAA